MTLKLFILAIIFVLTSGALFSDFFKKHKFLTFLASIMAIISSFFLLQDIMSSIKKDVIADLQNNSQENALQAQLDKEHKKNEALQAQLEALKKKPGTVFRDSLADDSFGPEMVWIPAGSFRMGDIQGGGWDNEKPVHRVSVDKFAMGKFEVTVGEFRKFVNSTSYKTDAEKQGSCYSYRGSSSGKNWQNLYFSQNDNHPVACVSWNDATAYTKWLSQQTGKQYRLPTEAEWEYAARAGTETKYWWGNDVGKNRANCWKDYCGDSFEYTSPVGSFDANQFGLYDTVGNLWEWTCSEYTYKYNNKEKQCVTNASRFVLRGGSWDDGPRVVRSAGRGWIEPTYRNENCGFRLVSI
jgi:formylglycine-generating enzyme required for sulfatase activity